MIVGQPSHDGLELGCLIILVDTKEKPGKTPDGSWELRALIQRQGISCESENLPYADACFEGFGPDGLVGIGIERKRLGDLLTCIKDGRLTGHQLVGMRKMYRFLFLIVEGVFQPARDGVLLEEHLKPGKPPYWSPHQHGGRMMYHTIRRFLFSMSLGGVVVLYTRDIAHSAFDITELYHYFQKPWKAHTSLLQLHQGYFWQKDGRTDDLVMLPTLTRKPALVRRWAAEIDGIGARMSEDVARVFKTPEALALGDEEDWQQVPRVGKATAQRIIKEIRGTS